MEIERKWLVKNLPDLSNLMLVKWERYFLFINDKIEIRIQKKGDKYELERKSVLSKLSREEVKFEITKDEYDTLEKYCSKSIIRAEVHFTSEEEAEAFKPLDWFGKEITDSPLGRDKTIINLSEGEFTKLMDTYIN